MQPVDTPDHPPLDPAHHSDSPPGQDAPIGALVLAAGASTRLGQPKQLLRFGSQTLLRHAVEAAVQAGCSPVVVVLGAAPQASAVVADLNVTLVQAADWAAGMGASIAAGVSALPPQTPAVLISLCDQPRVDAAVLRRLLRAHRPGQITAAAYDTTVGVPAVFDRAFFPRLVRLAPAAGAKQLIAALAENVTPVPVPEAATDIDTPADLEKFTASSD